MQEEENCIISDINSSELKFQNRRNIKENKIRLRKVNRVKVNFEQHGHLEIQITNLDEHKILECFKKDIQEIYLTKLDDYFTSEMKGFTAPNFAHDRNCSYSSLKLKQLFRKCKSYQVIIIYGEAGCGKTSLTR